MFKRLLSSRISTLKSFQIGTRIEFISGVVLGTLLIGVGVSLQSFFQDLTSSLVSREISLITKSNCHSQAVNLTAYPGLVKAPAIVSISICMYRGVVAHQIHYIPYSELVLFLRLE